MEQLLLQMKLLLRFMHPTCINSDHFWLPLKLLTLKRSFTTKSWKSSHITRTSLKPTRKESTNSLTWAMKSSWSTTTSTSLTDRNVQQLKEPIPSVLHKSMHQPNLIGEMLAVFPQWRIKAAADHAGPSQPLELLKPTLWSNTDSNSFLYQSNNLLTALEISITMDVQVDFPPMPLNTSPMLVVSLLRMLTLTLQRTDSAQLTQIPSSCVSEVVQLTSPLSMRKKWRMLCLPTDPFQLLSKSSQVSKITILVSTLLTLARMANRTSTMLF